jgi:hypothetical protein
MKLWGVYNQEGTNRIRTAQNITSILFGDSPQGASVEPRLDQSIKCSTRSGSRAEAPLGSSWVIVGGGWFWVLLGLVGQCAIHYLTKGGPVNLYTGVEVSVELLGTSGNAFCWRKGAPILVVSLRWDILQWLLLTKLDLADSFIDFEVSFNSFEHPTIHFYYQALTHLIPALPLNPLLTHQVTLPCL